ncbi:hypothetical protein SAMN02745121_00446 [Nannocystis exedens]|uniref:Uncharacterized protein n=1 Tax=Nannocystis exedens TaxID=54 RepID=A0A1I1T2F2_9BACT|nr:hypothetical protein NAEX_09421 [Nannocystis exedens]SFD52869.1 hypothetical protein SAMN02745121_00446 [Nannocystis exedens]
MRACFMRSDCTRPRRSSSGGRRRLPVIRLVDGAEECLLTRISAAFDRRQGGCLRGIVESDA